MIIVMFILVERRIAPARQRADAAEIAADGNYKEVVFKNWAWFIKCISIINNAEVNSDEDLDSMMPVYNLLEYCDNYSKTSASLWKHYRGEPDDKIPDFKLF